MTLCLGSLALGSAVWDVITGCLSIVGFRVEERSSEWVGLGWVGATVDGARQYGPLIQRARDLIQTPSVSDYHIITSVVFITRRSFCSLICTNMAAHLHEQSQCTVSLPPDWHTSNVCSSLLYGGPEGSMHCNFKDTSVLNWGIQIDMIFLWYEKYDYLPTHSYKAQNTCCVFVLLIQFLYLAVSVSSRLCMFIQDRSHTWFHCTWWSWSWSWHGPDQQLWFTHNNTACPPTVPLSWSCSWLV